MILHVGLHKAASTYLQAEVFPSLRGVQYVPKALLSEKIVLKRSHLVISSEAALGRPYPIAESFDEAELCSKVALFCATDILIVRREFASWITSLYLQSVNEGWSWTFRQFLLRNISKLETWRDVGDKNFAFALRDGVRVHVLCYEDLRDHPQKFASELSLVMGEPIHLSNLSRRNSSIKGVATLRAYRLLNWVIGRGKRRRVAIALGLSPRKLMRGRLGLILEALPQQRFNDYTSKVWEEFKNKHCGY